MKLWWEKTVEYCYILSVGGDTMLAPMDGKHESASDLLLAKDNRFVLIEFKRDSDAIDAEKEKFVNYEAALNDFRLKPFGTSHHLIVFGSDNQDGRFLKLGCKPYFSLETEERPVPSKEDLASEGIDADNLKNYLRWFLSHKRRYGGETGGGLRINDYSMVTAVGKESGKMMCITLHELFSVLEMKKEQEKLHQRTLRRRGPRLGR